jgi:hypothetical protein
MSGPGRRAVLAAGFGVVAGPAAAVAPCMPGQRPGTLAALRFDLAGGAVPDAAWRRFRAEVLDPALGAPVLEHDEPTGGRPPVRHLRTVLVEVDVPFDARAPERVPPAVQEVLRRWAGRFPAAAAEARLRPACFAR